MSSTGYRGPSCAKPIVWCATGWRPSRTSTASCVTGLGLRWSVIGPFETVDLNTRGGIAAHADRMGPSYARMGAERGQDDPWTPELVAEVTAQRRAALPLERWEARIAWRDRMLMALLRARRAASGDPLRRPALSTSRAGQTVAAALTAAGIRTWRTTRHGAPRGLFCGMGVCQDCLVTIDGRAEPAGLHGEDHGAARGPKPGRSAKPRGRRRWGGSCPKAGTGRDPGPRRRRWRADRRRGRGRGGCSGGAGGRAAEPGRAVLQAARGEAALG